jgi:L-2-hydroxycarboxylate dehydrogenase (NAD+)
VLVATLMTTALGRDVHGTLDADEVCNKGDLFISIDPSVLPAGSQQERVSAYLEAVRATPTREGSATVRIPGDRARAECSQRRLAGVEIPDTVWREVLALAQRTGPSPASGVQPGRQDA